MFENSYAAPLYALELIWCWRQLDLCSNNALKLHQFRNITTERFCVSDDEDSVIKFEVKTIQMSEFPQFHKSLLEPQLAGSWDIHKWIHSDKTLHRTCPIWNCPNFLNENEFIIMSPNTPNNSCYNQPSQSNGFTKYWMRLLFYYVNLSS